MITYENSPSIIVGYICLQGFISQELNLPRTCFAPSWDTCHMLYAAMKHTIIIVCFIFFIVLCGTLQFYVAI